MKCQDLKLLTTGKRSQLEERISKQYHLTALNPPPDVPIGDDDIGQSNETVAYDGTPTDDSTDYGNTSDVSNGIYLT